MVELKLNERLPDPFHEQTMWAKCDMVAAVTLERLDFFRAGRDENGKRLYIKPKLPNDDFETIKQAIRAGLGI